MANSKELELAIKIGGKVDSSLKSSVDRAKSYLGSFNSVAKGIGIAAGATFAVATTASIAAGSALLGIATDFDTAYDSIRIGTGATGDELAALKESFKSVYSEVPTTMENASAAVTDYNTRLNLTGDTLDTLSSQAIAVSDMLSEDLLTVTESSSKAFQQWNISSDKMAESMDYVFKVGQNTGSGFSALMQQVQQFGPQLQNMGYSFEQSTALIGQLDKAGVDTSGVLAAMKKSISAMAKEGISASDGLQKYYTKIKSAKTETEAIQTATEIFGSRGASTMSAAIRSGSLDITAFTNALSESGETIHGAAQDTYDYAEQLQLFKQQAQIALEPVGATIFNSINEAVPTLGSLLNDLAPILSDVITKLVDIAEDVFPDLVSILEEIVPILADTITSILPIAIELIGGLLPILGKIIKAVLPIVVKLIQSLLPVIGPLLNAILPIINALLEVLMPIIGIIIKFMPTIVQIIMMLTPLITTIANLVAILVQKLAPAISFIAGYFTSILGGAIAAIGPIIKGITRMFNGIIQFITGVFSGDWSKAWEGIVNIFGGYWDYLKGFAKAPLNYIIGMINTVIEQIDGMSFTVPDWVPEIGGETIGFNLTPITPLATGGVVTGPTHILAGEGSEPEAVLPISKLSSMLESGINSDNLVNEKIIFSPVVNIFADNINETEIKKATTDAMAEAYEQFKTLMRQYERDKKRLNFAAGRH